MPQRKRLVVQRVLSIKVPEELKRKLQEFVDGGDYPSLGEAVKVLLSRGLFITEKPAGRLSEAAFEAAYISAKGLLLDVALRKANVALQTAFEEAYLEIQSRQGKSAV